MRHIRLIFAAVPLVLLGWSPAPPQEPAMSFFLTDAGPGNGADLGGLEGADRYCLMLARTVNANNDRTWRAYLSTTGPNGVDARDRIGSGPWYNARGVRVAADVANLHSDSNNLTKESQLSEKGEMINGRSDSPNRHDILTGSQLDGTAAPGEDDTTCSNWTSRGEGERLGRSSRPSRRRSEPHILEFRACLAGLQSGKPTGHRRRWSLLLFRRDLIR